MKNVEKCSKKVWQNSWNCPFLTWSTPKSNNYIEIISLMYLFAYVGHTEAPVLNWVCFITGLKFLVVRLRNTGHITDQLIVHFPLERCKCDSICCPWIQDGSCGCCLEDGRTDGGRRRELEGLTVLRSDQFWEEEQNLSCLNRHLLKCKKRRRRQKPFHQMWGDVWFPLDFLLLWLPFYLSVVCWAVCCRGTG